MMFMHGKRPDGSPDTPPSVPEKRPIVIKRDKCVMTLYDVASFMQLPLANVRKMWAIMFDAVWENETTINVIREWLPEAAATAKANIKTLADELTAAKQDMETKRRAVAVMGTALMERITITKRELARARKKKLPAEQLAPFIEAHDKAMRPKTEHQLAEKEAARAESRLKTAKADLTKAEKLQGIFTEMATKARL